MCQIGSYHEIVYISWKWQKCKTARNWFSLFCSWQLFISQSILKYFHKERANSAELCTALYPSRKHNQMYYLRFEGWKYALSVKRMLLVFIRGELLWASEHGNGARRWELPFMELSDITFNSLYKSHPPSSGSPLSKIRDSIFASQQKSGEDIGNPWPTSFYLVCHSFPDFLLAST